ENTELCVRAERAFNTYLQGGCQVPIAGYATLEKNQITMQGRVGSIDGQVLLTASGQTPATRENALALGERLAQQLLDQGAGHLLQALQDQ
ncbi:MAG: hydroxymethylbilane synthase, partial [Acinetobacter sp.]